MTADRPAASPVTPLEQAIPFETIVVEKRGPACWVWLNRPAALNSLTLEMAHELEAAITAAEADPAVRSVVVTGAGRAFCAGADLAALHAHGGSIAAPLGDFLADDSGLGFTGGALLIGSLIALTALASRIKGINRVILFWIAFVLTRPFGATFGDLLTKPLEKGGLGFGTVGSSLVLFTILATLVALPMLQRKAQPAS